MATQAQIYKEANDTAAFVAQDLAILVKPWVKGAVAPDPLFDSSGIIPGALSPYLTVGEVSKKDGAKFSSESKFNPIEGYGRRTARRRLLDTDEGTLAFTPQEIRRIVMQLLNSWDEGEFTRTTTGGWRAKKSSGTRPKYWTAFMLGEDSNDETGDPIYQWFHIPKMGNEKGGGFNYAMDSTAMDEVSLAMFEDGDILYEMGFDGPGFAPLSGALGFDASPWLVTITGTPSGGTFTLSIGLRTTDPIAYNASAATVKAALVALDDGFGSSDWTVTGSTGGPFTITAPYWSTLTADGSALTGGSTPAVTVTSAP